MEKIIEETLKLNDKYIITGIETFNINEYKQFLIDKTQFIILINK